ncbi:glycosyltransferase [Crocinitomicaceae bacterium]|nr:glycosyltransferase [Crocinitomicaceae bacterium]
MSKPLKAIVSVTNDLYTDNRVHKICTFLHNNGYEVLLVGRKRRSSADLAPREYKTKRMRLLFETGAAFYAFFNLRLFFLLLSKKCDVLVSNDLDTLLANHMAKKFKRNCTLVYDSHEYFTEVPELVNRPSVQRIWLRIEKWIFPQLTHIYTVNDSIAKIYTDLYQKEIKVVRNISQRWQPENIKSKQELDIPENVPLIILQGAGINVDRGAEEAVEAMQEVDAVLMIVGDGDVLGQLKDRVKELGLESKVRFYGRRPYLEMMQFTYHADLGLTLDKDTNPNYKFSLPNKIFDYMHAGTPVVATNIIEVANVIRKNDIGFVLDRFTPDTLAKALVEIIKDPKRLDAMKTNCAKAAETENWENETSVLTEIYLKNG